MILNYEFDKKELESKIKKLEVIPYWDRTENQKNLLSKYKSEITENTLINFIADKNINLSVEYIKDSAEANRIGKISREDFKQNTMNCVGIDLLVEREFEWVRTDVKVLNYYKYSQGKIYNGDLNSKYGVDRFVFQIEGKDDTLGWGWNRYKQTDELIVMIPHRLVSKVYTFNYKALTRFIGGKLKVITTNERIVYPKGYKSQEVCISIPMEDIPKDVLISIEDIELPKPIILPKIK